MKYDAINKFVPKSNVSTRSFPKWYSKKLIKLIHEKKLNHKLYNQTNMVMYYYEFSRLRALC